MRMEAIGKYRFRNIVPSKTVLVQRHRGLNLRYFYCRSGAYIMQRVKVRSFPYAHFERPARIA